MLPCIQARSLTQKEQLVLSLEKQYPGDAGVLAVFFLSFVKLNHGEALYVSANEPHAYLGVHRMLGHFRQCCPCRSNSKIKRRANSLLDVDI